jgi:hypothetical protein
MDGWALPASAVEFMAPSASISTVADDLSFGEVYVGIALPLLAEDSSSSSAHAAARGSMVAFTTAHSEGPAPAVAVVTVPAPAAAVVAAPPQPQRAKRSAAADSTTAEPSDLTGRHALTAEERKRRNEEEARQKATIARLSSDNDRMQQDLAQLKMEVSSYRALETVINACAGGVVGAAQKATAGTRVEEEKKCVESLVRLGLMPAAALTAAKEEEKKAPAPGT